MSTFTLPNGATWDFSKIWEDQSANAQGWMNEAINPLNTESEKCKLNMKAIPMYYTCVKFQGVMANFRYKNVVESLTNI